MRISGLPMALCPHPDGISALSRIKIPRNLHTALLYGIKTDTDNFDRATIIEISALTPIITKHANMQFIRRIELNQTPDPFI